MKKKIALAVALIFALVLLAAFVSDDFGDVVAGALRRMLSRHSH